MRITFLTTEAVAEIFHVTPYTVLRRVREGKLGATKIGKSYRFTEDNILKFVRERRI